MPPESLSAREGARLLRSAGVKPSHSRMAVYRYLYENRNHPTVDLIYQALLPDFPTLSRTTVYNSLKLFVDQGLVKPVLIENGELRYDADTSFHGHAKCLGCDTVTDIRLDAPESLPAPDGFEVIDAHLYFRGLCTHCRPAAGVSVR